MNVEKILIVSDTGPLITLCIIDKLNILYELYNDIYIPNAVYQELNSETHPNEIEMIDGCDFIHVKDVIDSEKVSELVNSDLNLHLGESEAIILTEEINSNTKFLIVDDKDARNYAETRGINTIGAIGIMASAIKEGLLSSEELESCIDIMRKSHRYYSEMLYNGLRETAEEYKNNRDNKNKFVNKLSGKYARQKSKGNKYDK